MEHKAILPLLFGKDGPYGHPVIGLEEQVRAATSEIIKAHYDKWYHPNNASLVVCGGFDPDEALAKIKKLFGPIPKVELPERKQVSKEKLKRPARLDMESKFAVPRLLFGWNTISSRDDDYPALSVVEALLNGRTSRLYKKLVEGEEIAASVAASHNNAGRYPGWFEIDLELLNKKDADKAEKLLLAELTKLAEEPITDAEMGACSSNFWPAPCSAVKAFTNWRTASLKASPLTISIFSKPFCRASSPSRPPTFSAP